MQVCCGVWEVLSVATGKTRQLPVRCWCGERSKMPAHLGGGLHKACVRAVAVYFLCVCPREADMEAMRRNTPTTKEEFGGRTR